MAHCPRLDQGGKGTQKMLYAHTLNGTPQYTLTSNFQDQLNEWLKFREAFLDEALRHDGLGDVLGHTSCSTCGKMDGTIKCKDCRDALQSPTLTKLLARKS